MNRANYPEKAHRDQVSKRNNRQIINRKALYYLQKLQWSPEQIAFKERKKTTVSETIYRYVYNDAQQGGELYNFSILGLKIKR